MNQAGAYRTYAALAAAMALSLAASPAVAQSAGGYRQYCQSVSGRLVCNQASGAAGTTGARPYEQWQNGAPARASGSSSAYPSYDGAQFPHSFGAYSNLGGFGHSCGGFEVPSHSGGGRDWELQIQTTLGFVGSLVCFRTRNSFKRYPEISRISDSAH